LALTPGTRLGVYEVTAQIGEGGMGQVYRAPETKLGRHVTIKILPDVFAGDPDSLARFQREALVLASLNHPHCGPLRAGGRRVTSLLQTKFDERNGIVSPDGRWLAYDSNNSGSFQIYVRPFPNVGGGQWQVSTTGGTRPLWARNGKELFYVGAEGALLRLPVEASGATWKAGTPTSSSIRASIPPAAAPPAATTTCRPTASAS
jgi:hypothetical protein